MKVTEMVDGKLIFITGKRGSGKTTWIKSYLARQARVLVWDWRGEYDLPVVTLRDLMLKLQGEDFFKVRYSPNFKDDLIEQFDALSFCLLNWRCSNNFTLVVDEAYLVCPGGTHEGSLGRLIRLTRPKSIDLIVSSQRPTLIPGVFRSEADEWIVFSLHNPPDLYLVETMFGSACREVVQNLTQFQYICLEY